MKTKTQRTETWNTAKVVLRGTLQLKPLGNKKGLNTLTLQFKDLDKEQTKPRATGRKETMIGAKLSEVENRKTTEKIFDTKSWFSEKVDKFAKPLGRWSKK